MANNPEFEMKGISFVVCTTSSSGHPLPFKLLLPNGKRAEIQHVLKPSFTVYDVIAELRLLAMNLEVSIAATPETIDFPAAVASEGQGLKPPRL